MFYYFSSLIFYRRSLDTFYWNTIATETISTASQVMKNESLMWMSGHIDLPFHGAIQQCKRQFLSNVFSCWFIHESMLLYRSSILLPISVCLYLRFDGMMQHSLYFSEIVEYSINCCELCKYWWLISVRFRFVNIVTVAAHESKIWWCL